MFKVLTKDFLYDPILEMKIEEPTEEITLFGKTYRMYKDDWKHHIHLKITNRCDSSCDFCIERSTRNETEYPNRFLASAQILISSMSNAGHLRTVSITGGEPTVSPILQETIALCNRYDMKLFSMNTNGYKLDAIRPDSFNGWANISKHNIDDREIFGRLWNLDEHTIRIFKQRQKNAKVRLQCVLGVNGGLKSLSEIDAFIDYFKDSADDFSFRSLIIEKEDGKMDPLFQLFRDKLFLSGCLEEQAIQDYYVYEVYNYKGKLVTLSWSNMALLRKHNETHESEKFLEEIIVHPNGNITGSWNQKTLVIADGQCISCNYFHNGCRYESSGDVCH